jgi:hypothetical protein
MPRGVDCSHGIDRAGPDGGSLNTRIGLAVRGSLGRRWWLWAGITGIGIATHFGTALLRLKEFVPVPRVLDFCIYYVGAWSIRKGYSPFDMSPELLTMLREHKGFVSPLSPHLTSPLWALLLQPMTLFSFPAAAWVWLGILLGVTCLSTILLARTAGYTRWRASILLIPVVVTFGPTFLSLTLGQNTLFTLLAALAIGGYLKAGTRRTLLAPAAWLVAVAAKVYPMLWLVVPALLRRWRMLATAVIVIAVAVVAVGILNPYAGTEYWLRFLPGEAAKISQNVSVDDQAFSAWLGRMGRTGRYEFAGMDVFDRHFNIWKPPRELPAGAIRPMTLIILALLAAAIGYVWLRSDRSIHAEGMFYTVVLFGLLPFPHMERYNHVLMLPAMAWLWSQRGPYRYLAIIAYALVGLSRLNHLWAMILQWPWGPLASGFTIYAILVLTGGISHRIRTSSV